ncbi:MAG: STAS domain-containing protein [bacterium]
MDKNSILVGRSGGTAWVRVVGRGSFKNAPHVKRFADEVMQQGVTGFVVDLGKCAHMDSTFMGILAGLNLRLKKGGQSELVVVNVAKRNMELLHNLGLDKILRVEEKPMEGEIPQASPLAGGQETPQQIVKTMLEAHETLLEVDQRNVVKFQDVITYLRHELGVKDV